MKGYRKIKQEEEDSRVIAMACENGDPETIQFVNRNQEILDRFDELMKEVKGKALFEIKEQLKEMKELIKEKDDLSKRFDLNKRKPQIYLENLKRKGKRV